jgi:hypothetical protein
MRLLRCWVGGPAKVAVGKAEACNYAKARPIGETKRMRVECPCEGGMGGDWCLRNEEERRKRC